MWSDRILLSERLIKVKKLVLFSVVLGGRSGPYTERKVLQYLVINSVLN